jgi:hypothetical protein
MLLHCLRAHSKAPGGVVSIWRYLETLTRATGVSGRFAYSFRTELHFADLEMINQVDTPETAEKSLPAQQTLSQT